MLNESLQFDWKNHWAKFITQSLSENNRSNASNLIVRLLDANEKGDSCISVLNESPIDLLGNLLSTDKLDKPFFYDGEALYLQRHHELELRLVSQIKRLITQETSQFKANCDNYEHLLNDEYQKNALVKSFKNNLSIITGGPGTGKTFTLARIIASLDNAFGNPRIAMAAPTGKASQRMQEALQSAFLDQGLITQGLITDNVKNIIPVTLHRLLGIGQSGVPHYNKDQKLPFDILVVDEVSMLDLELATMFFEAVPDNSKVILLGDANQLASVDVGYVLADLQKTDLLKENIVNLVHSRRFSDKAMIGKVAKFIQADRSESTPLFLISEFEKIVPPSQISQLNLDSIHIDAVQLEYLVNGKSSRNLETLYAGYLEYVTALKKYQMDNNVEEVVKAFERYRILSSTRHGNLGVFSVNNFIEDKLIMSLTGRKKSFDWYLGRPVMITVNNYQLGLSNGDIGICLNHRTEHGQFEVFFPSSQKWVSANRLPSNIETAFAITIHKSQGSEFDHVAVILDEGTEKMLSQELIYTGITRAKKAVSIFATPDSLGKAISTKTKRQSGLIRKFNDA